MVNVGMKFLSPFFQGGTYLAQAQNAKGSDLPSVSCSQGNDGEQTVRTNIDKDL